MCKLSKLRLEYLFLFVAFLCIQGNTYIIDPQKNAVWHNEKGLYYFKESFYNQAAYEFKLAILLSNNTAATASFYNNLGMVYQKAGRNDWALQSYQKAIKMNPNFLEYYKNMISIYKTQKKLSSVISQYSVKARDVDADSKVWLVLGLTYLEMNKYDDALYCLKKFKKMEPNLLITQGVDKIIDKFK